MANLPKRLPLLLRLPLHPLLLLKRLLLPLHLLLLLKHLLLLLKRLLLLLKRMLLPLHLLQKQSTKYHAS